MEPQIHEATRAINLHEITMAAFRAMDKGNMGLAMQLGEERQRVIFYQQPTQRLPELLRQEAELRMTYATA